MAYFTHSAPAAFGATFFGWVAAAGRTLKTVLAAAFRAAEINSTAHQRLAAAERLHAKTDDELATLGIKREQIAHHVFRDLFWH